MTSTFTEYEIQQMVDRIVAKMAPRFGSMLQDIEHLGKRCDAMSEQLEKIEISLREVRNIVAVLLKNPNAKD